MAGIIFDVCTCHQEETEDHDTRVAKIQECRCGFLDIQLKIFRWSDCLIIKSEQVYLCHEVVDTVHCEVESCEAAGEEASPPPMIILG